MALVNFLQVIVFLCLGLSAITVAKVTVSAPVSQTTEGFSVFDKRKYPDGFHHFDYVNPNAPKGGRVNLSAVGTFNSLNPFIVRGDYPAGIGLTFSLLMTDAKDRAGESYAFVAEFIEVDPKRRYVIFRINPKAQFDDGVKITADTVIWSFNTLKEKGQPMFRTYYKNVTKVEKINAHTVKFYLDDTDNPELPLILGQVYILPKHFYDKHPFDQTSLVIPPTAGPYRIKSIDPGRSIVYERVKNWWGESIASQRGKNNFDEIRYDFYLDPNSQFEAFKRGRIDIRGESSMKTWHTGYDFPAVSQKAAIKEELPYKTTQPTYGFFFNTRHPIFQDHRIREALTILYNFDWVNKNVFYGSYTRNLSYYANSCFAARELPSEEELTVLSPYRNQLDSRIFEQPFSLGALKKNIEIRKTLHRATELFKEVGWVIDKGTMRQVGTGVPFEFEILIDDQSKEKLCIPYVEFLQRLGVKAVIRSIDKASYTQRVESKNFDMVLEAIPQSNSLGNEQRDFFGSSRADAVGSRNFAGIKNPIVDSLIETLIQSNTYNQLCHRARALDRVLLWGFYMIPAWSSGTLKVVYWDKFGHPKEISFFNPFDIQTWWYDPEKAAALDLKISSAPKGGFFRSLWGKVKRVFGHSDDNDI
ncbi:MAG: ABC transporter substrate-binding protein [Candidatus Paracaedibacteraceae bacterium]|nr:ABC transporter substrate-binding protein [Candidatus Paracaedibacteraceae bacterium]